MNIRVLLLSLCAAVALSGCGQKGPATTSEPSGQSAAATGRTIEITANDQMKYNISSIVAKPGEQLHVVLTNAGTAPKEAMAHNWILLKAGNDVMAFSAAAATHKDTNFIPENLKDQIIAKIDLLGPKETGEVSFKAPEQPGEYPFLCSFPGHAALMKGVLTVK